MTQPHTVRTIGHSTRSIEELLALLEAHGIQELVDVRTIPRSRHNPQFNRDVLAERLGEAGMIYYHMPGLGGLRKPAKDSINTGWRNASFRGYADYMQTEAFHLALTDLMTRGTERRTAVMCAEAVPWRCHRSLIADALLARGWAIRHILSASKAEHHALTPFAVIDQTRVTYPSQRNARSGLPLF